LDDKMDKEILFECPVCSEVVPHEIIKKIESKRHLKLTVRCLNCGHTHNMEKTVKLKDIKIIISRYGESEKKVVQFPTDEILEVGDVINIQGEDVEIASIETTKRVSSSKIQDIETLWAKSISIPKKVGISINDGKTTYSVSILVPQDYVFDNESIYRIGNAFFRIKMIKTEKGTFKREIAGKIKRIYAENVKPFKKYKDLSEYYSNL